jgi:hypothetical protein
MPKGGKTMTHTALNRYSFNRHALHRYLLTTVGVLLSTVTLTAMAAPSERERFAECKDLAEAHYGNDTRVRLYNIRNRAGTTELRLRVNPADAAGANLLCTAPADEDAVLRTRDGVAIEPASSTPVALAER